MSFLFDGPSKERTQGKGGSQIQSLKNDVSRAPLSPVPAGSRAYGLVAAILVFPLLSSCMETIELPTLGECAEYPDGLYDYGDMGIGSCISGPVDVYAHGDADDYRLYVSNSNSNLLFSSGSLMSLSQDAINSAAESGGTFLVHELIEGSEYAYPTRTFSGQMVHDPLRDVFFYTNRLSYTTALGADDRIEAVHVNDGKLELFEDFDLETGDGSYATVGEDPFALARQSSTGQLYVLDTTSHDLMYFDTDPELTDTVRYGRTVVDGLMPEPVFTDRGDTSVIELAILEALEDELPPRSWEITYLESSRRMFYPVSYNGTTALGMADSGDGLVWRPNAANPVLKPGDDDDAFDKDGIDIGALYTGSDGYFLWYTGYNEGLSSIGLAYTTGTWTGSWVKHDVDDDGLSSNDAVLAPSEDYELGGVSRPVLLRPTESEFKMWYNATGLDGITRIAGATGDSALGSGTDGWLRDGLLLESETPGESVADPRVYVRAFGDGGYAMYYVEGDLNSSTCMKYAAYDSDGSDYAWYPGGLDEGATGCLLSQEDGLPAILRSPVLSSNSTGLVLWIYGADDPDGPWSFYKATSYDGFDWTIVGESTVAPPSSTASEEALAHTSGGNLVLNLLTEGTVRIKQVGDDDYTSVGIGTIYDSYGLTFVVLEGHVLTLPGPKETWWGAPEGVPAGTWARLGAPAYLPGAEKLAVSTFFGDDEPDGMIGFAERVPGDDGAELPFWKLPTGCVDENCNGLIADNSTGSFDDPWLMEAGDGSDAVWMYATFDADDEPGIVRMDSLDGGETWGVAQAVLTRGSTAAETGYSGPTVVLGHDGRYQMWYVVEQSGGNTIGHATSTDGLSFIAGDAALSLGEPGSWDDLWLGGPTVIWDATGTPVSEDLADVVGVYRMWYSASDGARVRIGYADGVVEGNDIVWYRYIPEGSQLRTSIFASSTLGWDLESVINPVVVQDGPDAFRMWFEGELAEGYARIGYATSVNGYDWIREALAGTAADTFEFSSAPQRIVDTDDPRGDATISIELGNSIYPGVSATEVEMVPVAYSGDRLYADGTPVALEDGFLQCFAVITARYTPGLYVMDVFDDSSSRFADGRPGPCVEMTNPSLFEGAEDGFVDSNYNYIEMGYRLSGACDYEGARTVAFSPDGRHMYMTSAYPDRLLIVDAMGFVDTITSSVNDEYMPILGSVEVGRSPQADCANATDVDLDAEYSQDIGPTGLAISSDGRYAFVANGNEHSVYTIDLQRGTYGQIISIAEEIGDIPFDVTLTPDGRWLVVGNYAGEIQGNVANSSIAIISADPDSPEFGQQVASIKNQEL